MSLWERLFGGGKSEEPQTSPPKMPDEGKLSDLRSSASADLSQRSAARDRAVRVFVSSTFRDMIEDRNELMAQVWPALRRACRGRAVEFVDVDLRWGVTEEQSQRKETVRHCLAEIKRCRPYFIGLLGERYGWVPDAEAYSPALLDEEAWLHDEVAKRSVTEIEILHGVLNDPEMAGRSFFYFRDPKYAEARGGDYLPEETARPTRQDALKQHVKKVCEAKRIPLREHYADPHALGKLVLADLTAAIDAEFPPDQVPDVWAREERDHEAYARSRRTEFYVGRDAYFKTLDDYARDGANQCGQTVLGESGGGKSALLANWVERWRKANPNYFVFQHYIGSSAISAGHLALMRRLMVAIIRWCRDEGEQGPEHEGAPEEARLPAQAEEIVKAFPGYLDRLVARAHQKGVRAIVVLDALNQLEDRERGRLLAWLPHRLPGDLRIIVSTLPGDTFDALQPRAWPSLTVEPLTADERIQLIARYLAHFSQGLSEVRAQKIASVDAASNPLYIKSLLDDLRITGDHSRLGEQIDDYLHAPDIPALLGKILTRYERDYQRDRPGMVGEALALLWAARRGLTEPELLEMLKPAGRERLPAGIWSPVRCALEDGLVDRDGVLAFAHDHLRVAVERKYVPAANTAKALRLRLADDFAARQLDARQADELPWLLRQAESRERLRTCLLDIDRFLVIQARDQDELFGYWVWLKEDRTMGKSYLEAFEVWAASRGETTEVSHAAAQISLFLQSAAVYAEAEPLIRRSLEIAVQQYGANHREVGTRLNNLAALLHAMNRFGDAVPLMRRCLHNCEQTYGLNHPRVAIYLSNLANCLQTANRLAEAEPLVRRALKISEEAHEQNHPDIAIRLTTLGLLLQATGRLAEAEPLLRRALQIGEQAYGTNHPTVALRLNNLAMLLHAGNRIAEAEPIMRRAFEISEHWYGEQHPDIAIKLNNVGVLLRAMGRHSEAEPLMRRALQIDEYNYGENHSIVARDLNNLAQLLQDANRLTEAEPLMRRALQIDERSFGEHHPNVAIRLNNLAHLLQATNRLAEAEPLSRRQLEIFLRFTRDTGHAHPHLRAAVNNYAGLLQEMGRSEEEIRGSISGITRRYGVDLGASGGPAGGEPPPRLRAAIERLMQNPSNMEEMLARLQREDPALLAELMQWIQSQQGR